MSLKTLSAEEARRRVAEGSAILVDIREAPEHAREAIPGAKLAPMSKYRQQSFSDNQGKITPAIIFHCQSGKRTADNADQLGNCGVPEVYLLEGGLGGWKAAGLPTRVDHTKPIEMQRQVQIVAGSLVLVGIFLSALSPWFIGIAAFVGSGLVFAGISGWCGMARLLAVMPWNRIADQ